MSLYRLIILLIIFACFYPKTGYAAADTDVNNDDYSLSLNQEVFFSVATGTDDLLPHWLVFNRGGRLGERQIDGFTALRLNTDWLRSANNRVDGLGAWSRDHIPFGHLRQAASTGNHIRLQEGRAPGDPLFPIRRQSSRWFDWRPDIRAGVDILAKTTASESRIFEAFVSVRYGPFQLTAGKQRYTTGFPDPYVSTGSMGISPNAAPLPRISLSIPEYTIIPLTYGFFEIKGQFSHGWLNDDRFMENPWLHEKYVFVRTRSDWPFQLRGGFSHFVFWGGTHPTHGVAPRRFEDYIRVLFGKSADPDYEGSQEFQGWIENAIGDHKGVIEFGIAWQMAGMDMDIYRQFFFEDGSGMRFYYNKDGLNGFRIRPRTSRYVHTILFEYLSTTWQTGPGPSDPPNEGDRHYHPDEPYFDDDYPYSFGGRDNYYNHGQYRHGWTYHGFSIGPSIMMRDNRARFYYPNAVFPANRFVSNRARAWHIGIEGHSGTLAYRLLLTRTRHLGTYNNVDIFNDIIDTDAPFAESPTQYHTMLEVSGPLLPSYGLEWNAAVGWDTGNLANHAGVLAGLRWRR